MRTKFNTKTLINVTRLHASLESAYTKMKGLLINLVNRFTVQTGNRFYVHECKSD